MKKAIVIVSAMMFAGLVQASELWWTVSNVNPEAEGWDTAKLMANSGHWGYGTNIGGEEVGAISAEDLYGFGGTAITELGKYDSAAYSFYVELFKGGQSVGKSYVSTVKGSEQGSVAYGDLVGSIDNPQDVFNPGVASPYSGFSQFGTGDVVPEPTSGLLMALGMMLFGLKRKRV